MLRVGRIINRKHLQHRQSANVILRIDARQQENNNSKLLSSSKSEKCQIAETTTRNNATSAPPTIGLQKAMSMSSAMSESYSGDNYGAISELADNIDSDSDKKLVTIVVINGAAPQDNKTLPN